MERGVLRYMTRSLSSGINDSTACEGMFGFCLISFGELTNVFDQGHQHGDLENLIDCGIWTIQLRGETGTPCVRMLQWYWR